MLTAAAGKLGSGTTIGKETARLVRSLGPETEHSEAITDPAAARQKRIDTRREWPDSPMSDVPDRFPLFQIFKDVDIEVWPELGTAVDQRGRIAAHLRDTGQWIVIKDSTQGQVVVDRQPSGRLIARAVTGGCPLHGFQFKGPESFLQAAGLAKEHIDRLEAEAHMPEDRG